MRILWLQSEEVLLTHDARFNCLYQQIDQTKTMMIIISSIHINSLLAQVTVVELPLGDIAGAAHQEYATW